MILICTTQIEMSTENIRSIEWIDLTLLHWSHWSSVIVCLFNLKRSLWMNCVIFLQFPLLCSGVVKDTRVHLSLHSYMHRNNKSCHMIPVILNERNPLLLPHQMTVVTGYWLVEEWVCSVVRRVGREWSGVRLHANPYIFFLHSIILFALHPILFSF